MTPEITIYLPRSATIQSLRARGTQRRVGNSIAPVALFIRNLFGCAAACFALWVFAVVMFSL